MKEYGDNKTHMILYNPKWRGLCVGIGLIPSLFVPIPMSLDVASGALFISGNFVMFRLRIESKDISTMSF
jgi:hypothetical protein